jgi:hypothetical protein
MPPGPPPSLRRSRRRLRRHLRLRAFSPGRQVRARSLWPSAAASNNASLTRQGCRCAGPDCPCRSSPPLSAAQSWSSLNADALLARSCSLSPLGSLAPVAIRTWPRAAAWRRCPPASARASAINSTVTVTCTSTSTSSARPPSASIARPLNSASKSAPGCAIAARLPTPIR